LTDHLPAPGSLAGDANPSDQAPPGAPAGKYDTEVDRLFGAAGPLAPAVGTFKPREAQTEMAKAIAQAIADQQVLMAEAGTGTGKTFAYLVPALLWGGKTIISTGTKNLQDQLFLRDIPTVRAALRAPVSVALLKGRSNYVCHWHLERTLQNGRLTSRDDVGHLREISRFMKTRPSWPRCPRTRRCGTWSRRPGTTAWAPSASITRTAS
jgi:ATP-dependent DNA helicase DinG